MKIDNKLRDIYANWEQKLEVDEWYFDNAFSILNKEMNSHQAFNYIPNIVSMLLELKEGFLIWETLYFLIEVYGQADTTEIHPFLHSKWDALSAHVRNYPDAYQTPFHELKRLLRIK
ncbi:ABC transporter [Priestia filamentosa]|uniref:ABC transporter n=1 Tax=Priestia filamentosa TaxID=1402861 RepID=UPI00397A7C3C